jgi:hypothetical protein
MRIVERAESDRALQGLDVLPLIESGLLAYSGGRAVARAVGMKPAGLQPIRS